jgi:hypothetical protein
MSAPNLRPLGFGEILDGAFTLYRRNLATFVVTSLLPVAVMAAAFVTFGGAYFEAALSGDPSAMLGAMGSFFIGMFIGGLAYLAMWTALTRQAAQAYLGQPTSVADGTRTGIAKLLAVAGAAFLIGILFLVAYFAVAIVFVVIVGIGTASGSTAMAVIFGLVAGLLAVAAYLGAVAMLFAVVPAIVVEDKGPIEAIGRSVDLARGALGRVVGLMVVTLLITYLPGLAVMFLTGGFANLVNPDVMPTSGQFMTQQLLGLGAGMLTTPFMVSVIVLLYFDRRVRTEALDVQMATDRLAMAGD